MSSFSQLIVATAMACMLSCVMGDTTNNPPTGKASCAFGFYYSNSGAVCLPCPAGTTGFYGGGGIYPSDATKPYPLGGNTCLTCPGGWYGNGTTVIAPVNQYFPAFVEAGDVTVGNCTQCAAGFYSAPLPNPASTTGGGWLFTVGASTCSPCPPGFVSNPGATECTTCPAGFVYVPQSCQAGDGTLCTTTSTTCVTIIPPTCKFCVDGCPSPPPHDVPPSAPSSPKTSPKTGPTSKSGSTGPASPKDSKKGKSRSLREQDEMMEIEV